MVRLEPVTSQNVLVYREVRLRALQDAPHAFGSTYAKELQFEQTDWLERVARWDGKKGIGFLALQGADVCGIAGALLNEDDPTQAQLVSMWTDPACRRQGVGRLLVDKVAAWARLRGVGVLQLMVTSVNEPALSFYQRLGFARTGRTEPYPNDRAVVEYEMALKL